MQRLPDAGDALQQLPENIAAAAPLAEGQAWPTSAATGGDAVTTAMVQQLARELTAGSLSVWGPHVVQAARRYFGVNHSYVARKLLWLLVPRTSKRKLDGEINDKKDWSGRVFDGLEADMEEPDMYIPLMGFVTYVLLCGVTLGVQDRFQPEVLSATVTYAVTLLVIEVTVAKAALFMTGASTAPTLDLIAMLGYKYCYVALQLAAGLLLGFGRRPSGFVYSFLTVALYCCCAAALWQTFRKLQRMHPAVLLQESAPVEVHAVVIKAVPVAQVALCWLLIPSWPRSDTHAAGVVLAKATTTAALVNASAARHFP